MDKSGPPLVNTSEVLSTLALYKLGTHFTAWVRWRVVSLITRLSRAPPRERRAGACESLGSRPGSGVMEKNTCTGGAQVSLPLVL